jgi:Holliday junction DNA helicase RuvA
MISRIEGELLGIDGGRAELRVESLVYELLVPAADMPQLAALIGQSITFHTLHYLESQGQGSSYVPRLIGFSSPQQRDFFELLTTVKGLGPRKTLRALEVPVGIIARAIAERDAALLVSLPEIGKRTAETIIAELHGKVDRFVEIKPAGDYAQPMEGVAPGKSQIIADAVAVLVQLGDSRLHARQLVDRALSVAPNLATADALVAAAVQLRDQ